MLTALKLASLVESTGDRCSCNLPCVLNSMTSGERQAVLSNDQGSHSSWIVLEKYPQKSCIFLLVKMEKQSAIV